MILKKLVWFAKWGVFLLLSAIAALCGHKGMETEQQFKQSFTGMKGPKFAKELSQQRFTSPPVT